MKIKVFSYSLDRKDELEQKVNEFTSSIVGEVVDIKMNTELQSSHFGEYVRLVATVIYKGEEQNGDKN